MKFYINSGKRSNLVLFTKFIMTQTHRFFVRKEKINPRRTVVDDASVIKKMRNVLRLEVGDNVVLFDGEGGEYNAEISSLRKEGVELKITSRSERERSEKPYLILGQALTRSTKIDEVVRMNTEIGVSEFVFFASDYSIVKLKDFNEKKLVRWEKIAQESARQSERMEVPKINFPIGFDEVLNVDADVKIFLHSREVNGSVDFRELRDKTASDKKVLVLIGPEGGFSDSEVKLALQNGFIIAFLALPVLRTETVGAVVSSIILY